MAIESSKVLQNAVEEMSYLPGIGKRTALRLVLHLLKQDKIRIQKLSESLSNLVDQVVFCETCHNISDTKICGICDNVHRDDTVICLVRDIRDVIAVENTAQFKGKYHVLGGLISPIDGIGPDKLNLQSLADRVDKFGVKEIIFALNSNMEGETTMFYVYKLLQGKDVHFTNIAHGIAIGEDLEYADEITLGKSIDNRIPYEKSFK